MGSTYRSRVPNAAHENISQPSSPEASSVCDQIVKLAIEGQEGEYSKTRYTIITKVCGCNQAKQMFPSFMYVEKRVV